MIIIDYIFVQSSEIFKKNLETTTDLASGLVRVKFSKS